MRYGLSILLAFCIFTLVTFISCSKSPVTKSDRNQAEIKVLSTTKIIGDLVEAIGGDLINHTVLVGTNLDPHSYELVKGDDEKVFNAHIIFFNGLNLEHGFSLKDCLTKHRNAYAIGDLVYSDNKEKFIRCNGALDPHFWMDVSLFSKSIPYIVEILTRYAPEHANTFSANGKRLTEKLKHLDQFILSKMRQIPEEKRYLVSSHDAYFYFTRRYLAEQGTDTWRKHFIAPEGLAPDGQLGVKELSDVCSFLMNHQVKTVFAESTVNKSALKKIISICRSKGHVVEFSSKPLYGDALGASGSGAENYVDMMQYNTTLLTNELNK